MYDKIHYKLKKKKKKKKYGCLTSFQKSAEYLITLHIHSRMAGWLAVGRTSIFLEHKPWGGRVPTGHTVWACAPHPDIYSRILGLDIHRTGDQCGEQQVYPREPGKDFWSSRGSQKCSMWSWKERAGLRGGNPSWYLRWTLHQGDGWRQGNHASSFPPEKADFFWEIKKYI